MRELVYGTGNPAKVVPMKDRLAPVGIQVLSPMELGFTEPAIEESGETPLENAVIKAKAWYRVLKRPVFSCDAGIWLEGIPADRQRGIHVRRRADGSRSSDEEMIEFYSSLAKEFGEYRAYYVNAVCLVLSEDQVISRAGGDLNTRPFLVAKVPHPKRTPGFPIDSLSKEIATGEYYFDLPPERIETLQVEDGFLRFFREALS